MAGKPLKDALRPLRRALPSARPAVAPAPVVAPEPVFAELFADVRPLKADQRYPHRPAPPPHWPRHSTAHHPPHPATASSSHGQITDSMVGWFEPATLDASFVRPGMQRHTLKKLRQGHWPQVAELDLHGLSRFDAQQHLAVLLHRARQLGQCVRVIHGKGLAIVRPELSVTLLDSNSKKTAFLRQAAIELALPNISVHCGRVEQYHPPVGYAAITSRAFAELVDFVSLSRHLLAVGGRWLAMKGVWPVEEIARLPNDVSIENILRLQVPGVEGERHLAIMKCADANNAGEN